MVGNAMKFMHRAGLLELRDREHGGRRPGIEHGVGEPTTGPIPAAP
jgi:hypothetical protein